MKQLKAKDNRSYSGFKFWSTGKLEEIIFSGNNSGVNGHDYGPFIGEIKSIYYQRLSEKDDRDFEQWEKEQSERYE